MSEHAAEQKTHWMSRISTAMKRNSDLISATESAALNFNTQADATKNIFALEKSPLAAIHESSLSSLIRTVKERVSARSS